MYAIVLADANWGIGKDGKQPLFLPDDLRRFRALTDGHPILVGRKTLLTFPGGRPLPGRRNLILSRQAGFSVAGAEVFSSLPQLLAAAPQDSFVVGGDSLYRQLLPYCDTAYVTRVDAVLPADRHFPALDADLQWREAAREGPFTHEACTYSYVTYRRRAEPAAL